MCLGQLEKLQDDMEALRVQRESTICSTREELYSAQEEVQSSTCSLLQVPQFNLTVLYSIQLQLPID